MKHTLTTEQKSVLAFLIENGPAAIGSIRNRCHIGYQKAMRIVETLEAAGLVARDPDETSKKLHAALTKEEFSQQYGASDEEKPTVAARPGIIVAETDESAENTESTESEEEQPESDGGEIPDGVDPALWLARDEVPDEALPVLLLLIYRNHISTVKIQRTFRMGFNKAARIVDDLVHTGFAHPDPTGNTKDIYASLDISAYNTIFAGRPPLEQSAFDALRRETAPEPKPAPSFAEVSESEPSDAEQGKAASILDLLSARNKREDEHKLAAEVECAILWFFVKKGKNTVYDVQQRFWLSRETVKTIIDTLVGKSLLRADAEDEHLYFATISQEMFLALFSEKH